MNSSKPHFTIVDDDPINNKLCIRYLGLAFPGSHADEFTNPQQWLDHIRSANAAQDMPTILLLNINMPILSGWDVLATLANFPDEIKQQFKIYILSSSIDTDDKQRAANNPLVSGFIEKPLSIPQLQRLFPQYT